MQNLLYFLYGKAYINITNACTNACEFCVRNIKKDVKGAELWLENPNVQAQDVIKQIEQNIKKIELGKELVFCGYGEPLMKFAEVKKVCEYVKNNIPDVKIRINTNGHGNIANKKNIIPELALLVDFLSISLNAQNEELYNKISKPKIENAYNEMLLFAKKAVEAGIDTTMSIVTEFKPEIYKIDVFECEKIAQKLGAKFRNRKWIKQGY